MNYRILLMFVIAALIMGLAPLFLSPAMALMAWTTLLGMAVIFLSRWYALVLVGITAVLVQWYPNIDIAYVLPGIVWVLVFSWVLLDIKRGTLSARGIVAPAAAAFVRLLVLVILEIAVGVEPFSPIEEVVALFAGGYASIVGAAWLGPQLKRRWIKE